MEIGAFIAKWLGKTGGAERSNYQLFLTEFAQALSLPTAEPGQQGILGAYQFDGPVPGGAMSGATGFIDLYKRNCFVLEAKQSRLNSEEQARLPLEEEAIAAQPATPAGARYDRLMRDALTQARRYATSLPGNEPSPPFLIVADIGRAFELYYDWTGNGRGYAFFPDKNSYRYELDRFVDDDVQKLFRAIWTDPASIDPRAKSAEVTRDVARRLSDVSKWLEATQKIRTTDKTSAERSLAIEDTALFLMRLLFCMFAEDVGLLPKASFTAFLSEAVESERHFENGLAELWAKMGDDNIQPRWSWVVKDDVRYFNGGLFASSKIYGLSNADRGELLTAAKADWTRVEPAIFGTLLEQALTPSERAKLGAHYTPRAYVERLVQATIMDVLEAEWAAVQANVRNVYHQQVPALPGNEGVAEGAALILVNAFHERLAKLRVLDPACGTGNFLYVAMEALMRLETDVIETIASLGGHAEPQVGPHQFFGLELNPRAAVIAELVLWIGWLRWRTANDPASVPDPVLRRTDTINFGGHSGYDAVVRRTPNGDPDTVYPTLPDWPEADFIIGNPPFIGKGAIMRSALGSDYVEALGKANARVKASADFVMQWWDRAAHLLISDQSPLIRFGFVTTNSITQTFNRRVIEQYLSPASGVDSTSKLSLIFAVPDHPWTKATKDAAAVRIAMTVAERGAKSGRLIDVLSESGLASDSPVLITEERSGRINPDLSLGADVTAAYPLHANEGLSNTGMLLAGQGFKISGREASHLAKLDGPDAHLVIRPYIGGGELMDRPKGRFVIDFFGLSESEARKRFPASYQHVLATVKPERDSNPQKSRRENWWLFGRSNAQLRAARSGLTRFIATVETAKHRVFQFVDGATVPDHMAVSILLDDSFALGVLTSNVHLAWALQLGGTLEDRPRYNKAACFDPFPFPDATPEQRTAIADLAEELDAMRRAALEEVSGLTMTEIYNLREKIRSGTSLDLVEQDRARAARAGIVDRLHEQIDAAVSAAYGWPADLAPAEIVARLVSLNAERAAEEAAGTVRWLRPDYQRPRFGAK